MTIGPTPTQAQATANANKASRSHRGRQTGVCCISKNMAVPKEENGEGSKRNSVFTFCSREQISGCIRKPAMLSIRITETLKHVRALSGRPHSPIIEPD